MLNLNDEAIKQDGSGKSFDPEKIFGYDVVQDDEIKSLLENVTVTGFHVEQSDKGTYFDIVLTDSKGNTTNIREYEPDANRDDFEKKKKSQLTRLKHIVTKFTPEGTQLPAANTFPELWQGVQQLLGQHQCNTKPVRLKLVYNNKGYLSVPKYVPFMELMTVPATDSKLNLNPDFDNLIRQKPDAPQVATATADTASGDLPF